MVGRPGSVLILKWLGLLLMSTVVSSLNMDVRMSADGCRTKTDTPVNENITCSAKVYHGTNCTTTFLEGVYPGLYNMSEYPSKPYMFEVIPEEQLYTDHGYIYPGFRLAIRPTRDLSMKDVRGFHVHFDRLSDDQDSCVVIKLDQGIVGVEHRDANIKFEVTVWPLGGRRSVYYSLKCYSLPKPTEHDLYIQKYLTTGVARPALASSHSWTTSIVFNNITANKKRIVEVTFLEASADYQFTKYELELTLLMSNSDHSVTIKSIPAGDEPKWTFNDIESPGVYTISVTPVQDAPSNCSCKDDEKCASCTKTTTQPFNLYTEEDMQRIPETTSVGDTTTDAVGGGRATPSVGDVRTTPTHSVGPAVDISVVIPVSVGVAIVCVGFAVVFVVICRKGEKWRDFQCKRDANSWTVPWRLRRTVERRTTPVNTSYHVHYGPDELADEGQGTRTRKTIYLVYAEDNESHIQIAEAFATILQKHCMCDVLYYPWYAKTESAFQWSVCCLAKADNTLLISSRSAYEQYMSWKNDRGIHVKHYSPTGDIYLVALRQVSKYLVENPDKCRTFASVYFEHTHEVFVPGDIFTGGRFRLMEHFDELLCYIHNITKGDLKRGKRKSDILKTSHGKILLEAIKSASKCERESDSGFQRSTSEELKIVQEMYTHDTCDDISKDRCVDNFVLDPKVMDDLYGREPSISSAITLLECDLANEYNTIIYSPHFNQTGTITHPSFTRHEAEVHNCNYQVHAPWPPTSPYSQETSPDSYPRTLSCHDSVQNRWQNQSDKCADDGEDGIPSDMFLPPDSESTMLGDTASMTLTEYIRDMNENYANQVAIQSGFACPTTTCVKCIPERKAKIHDRKPKIHDGGPYKAECSSSFVAFVDEGDHINSTTNGCNGMDGECEEGDVFRHSAKHSNGSDDAIPADMFLPPDTSDSDTVSQTQSEYVKQIHDNYMAQLMRLPQQQDNINPQMCNLHVIVDDSPYQETHCHKCSFFDGHRNDVENKQTISKDNPCVNRESISPQGEGFHSSTYLKSINDSPCQCVMNVDDSRISHGTKVSTHCENVTAARKHHDKYMYVDNDDMTSNVSDVSITSPFNISVDQSQTSDMKDFGQYSSNDNVSIEDNEDVASLDMVSI